jgi:hypothetical protein
MKTMAISINENFMCKQFIGSLSFIEEHWIKQKKIELSKKAKPERLKNEKYLELSNIVKHEVNQLNP